MVILEKHLEFCSLLEKDFEMSAPSNFIGKSNCQYQYRALSYVWGVDKSLSKAVVNGQPITISANLDKAPRRLRSNDLRYCNLMCSCQRAWYAGQTNHEYTYPPTSYAN